MIKFKELVEVIVRKLNGGNGVTKANIFMDEKCKIMQATLVKGSSIGEHKHNTSCEVVDVLGGEATCTLDGVLENIKEGECHYCPKGSSHSICNNQEEDLVFMDVVTKQ